MAKGKNGHAVDGAGDTVADPSLNVGSLVGAEGRRQDDLRTAEARRQDDLRLAAKELADINNQHVQEIAVLRDKHSTDMAGKESGRVDSLRQGDREENTRATNAAQANIASLALTTTQLADTLRNQVASTAAAAENRQGAYAADVGKRLTAVELSLSEGKGKQTVVDPQQERLAQAVEKLVAGGDRRTGQGEGFSTSWGLLLGIVGLIATVLTIGGMAVTLILFLNRRAEPPLYVPAPMGTTLPAVPPSQVPR